VATAIKIDSNPYFCSFSPSHLLTLSPSFGYPLRSVRFKRRITFIRHSTFIKAQQADNIIHSPNAECRTPRISHLLFVIEFPQSFFSDFRIPPSELLYLPHQFLTFSPSYPLTFFLSSSVVAVSHLPTFSPSHLLSVIICRCSFSSSHPLTFFLYLSVICPLSSDLYLLTPDT